MKVGKGTIISILLGLTCTCTVSAKDDGDPYRLPPNYIVEHYDLALNMPVEVFGPDSRDYNGTVNITFQVSVETSEVMFHSSKSNIEITSLKFNENEVQKTQYLVDEVTDILTLKLTEKLIPKTSYKLGIDFKAKVGLSGEGIYKLSYVDDKNVTQYLITTQFESTSARLAFPCFDEPKYKATFAYKLTYPASMTAITNTPEIGAAKLDNTTNLKTSTFEVSPRMSSYLVALTISKYTCSEGVLEEGSDIKYRICSKHEKEKAREWAKFITPKVIEHLNSYTGIKYSENMKKLDQIAVVGKGGAMENWGLVIYGESNLLFDETTQTNQEKQSVATIVSHELSHQWFGDLVTCNWWSEIFLNEGFATLFQYYIAGYVLPDNEMEKQFVLNVLQDTLETDSDLDVLAIRSNASTPTEVAGKFGSISYRKGASVLRMIEHIVGRETFKKGIQRYLKDNKFKPVEPQNLWNALQSELGNSVDSINLTEVVENWITKPGYPLVTVSLTGTTIEMSQKRFLMRGNETAETKWYVPISYTTSTDNDKNENTSPKEWITPTDNVSIANFPKDGWIVVNNQQAGFYRVNYETTLWDNLVAALKSDEFSGINVLNRAQIVDDSFNLAQVGILPYSRVFKNIEFLEHDVSFFAWNPALDIFLTFLTKIDSTSKLAIAIQNHFLKLMQKIADSVPLVITRPDDQIYSITQEVIQDIACKYGNKNCGLDAKLLFAAFKNYGIKPDLNIRSIVYCNGLRYSEEPADDWNFLWNLYMNESTISDKNLIFGALSCATDAEVIKSYLSKIFTDDQMMSSSQYTSILFSLGSASQIGVDTTLDYLIDNFDAILEKYESSDSIIEGILDILGTAMTTTSQIEKLEKFMTTLKNETILDHAKTALDSAKQNQAFIDEHKEDLEAYFKLNDNESDITIPIQSSTNKDDSSGATSLVKINFSIFSMLIILVNLVYFVR